MKLQMYIKSHGIVNILITVSFLRQSFLHYRKIVRTTAEREICVLNISIQCSDKLPSYNMIRLVHSIEEVQINVYLDNMLLRSNLQTPDRCQRA